MARPEFYGPNVGSVEVRETHVSRVFLVADRAYKLKKAVTLPFIDSSTMSRRRELCHQELRLNRRLAPDIYLGVRAVRVGGDGFELAGEDDPAAVDYVVEMRRYEEGATLAARLARGCVRRTDVVAVGRTLAEFHSGARRSSAPRLPALQIERRMEENFHELWAFVERGVEIGRLLELERFSHAFAVAHEHTLIGRARGGFIREVHGDLRAEHVVLGPRIQIVDCIEFDPQLRELDVADDIAFLVMDLTARGGERVVSALVGAYREAGGDPGQESLIAFYALHRALVRAKVALVRAAEQPAKNHERSRQRAAARDLITVAERFAWRARLPLALVVCGVPAVGKTEFAHVLAQASGLGHLNSDVTRKQLAGVRLDQRADPRFYSAEFSGRTYAELGRRAAREVLRSGGVIVDATFRHRADRQAFMETFADAAPIVFVECRAPAAVIAKRAAGRDRSSRHVSDATESRAVRESRTFEALDEIDASAHLTLRSDLPIDAQVADLKALLDRRMVRLLGHPHGDGVARA